MSIVDRIVSRGAVVCGIGGGPPLGTAGARTPGRGSDGAPAACRSLVASSPSARTPSRESPGSFVRRASMSAATLATRARSSPSPLPIESSWTARSSAAGVRRDGGAVPLEAGPVDTLDAGEGRGAATWGGSGGGFCAVRVPDRRGGGEVFLLDSVVVSPAPLFFVMRPLYERPYWHGPAAFQRRVTNGEPGRPNGATPLLRWFSARPPGVALRRDPPPIRDDCGPNRKHGVA